MKGVAVAYELKIRSGGYSGVHAKEDLAHTRVERTLHIFAKSKDQAESKAERQAERHNAHIISLTKLDTERGMYDVKNMRIELDVIDRHNAIAMDELITIKRNKRRDNLDRDKPADFRQ